jgi:excisionase family DNA binding protein
MTLSEASAYLGVAQATIRRWTDAGQLDTFKTPGGHRRFRQQDLDVFMSTAGNSHVPQSRHGAGAAHVLVVDDDAAVRDMICECLQQEGFTTDQAPDARSGILQIRERVPDLLLLDVRMPGMDGWAMLKRIREVLDVGDLPVIIYSGEISRTELGRAPQRGAQGYLHKPFDPASLVNQTKALLSVNA